MARQSPNARLVIVFILDMNKTRSFPFISFISSLFFYVFGFVYLQFVPGVSNLFMSGSFVFFFVLFIIEMVMYFTKKPKDPNVESWLYLGVLTLSLTSVLQGILDIALASHPWMIWLWFVGGMLTVITLLMLIVRLRHR